MSPQESQTGHQTIHTHHHAKGTSWVIGHAQTGCFELIGTVSMQNLWGATQGVALNKNVIVKLK